VGAEGSAGSKKGGLEPINPLRCAAEYEWFFHAP
jgi:hypothetical protein